MKRPRFVQLSCAWSALGGVGKYVTLLDEYYKVLTTRSYDERKKTARIYESTKTKLKCENIQNDHSAIPLNHLFRAIFPSQFQSLPCVDISADGDTLADLPTESQMKRR